jgi:hypothetical protein
MANIKFSQFTSSSYAPSIQLVGYDSATNLNVQLSISSLVGGTGTSGQLAVWDSSATINGNANLTWTLGSPNTLSVGGVVSVNTSGQPYRISTRYGANSDGLNIWIGNGGLSSVGVIGQTFKGSNNTSLGVDALLSITDGYQNVALGNYALRNVTTGTANVAVGTGTMQLSNSSNNIAVGYNALNANTSGSDNAAVGWRALATCTTGTSNVGVGNNTLSNINGGGNNVAVGSNALASASNSFSSVAIGPNALRQMTSGGANIAIGSEAGRYIATGTSPNLTSSTSIYIGSNTRPSADGNTNEIVISPSQQTGQGSNTTTIGNLSTTLSYLLGEFRIGTLNNLGGAASNFLTYSATNVVKTRTAAEVRSDIGLSNAITGSGTTNSLLKFTGSTTVGNSLIQDNGSVIGYNAAPNASYAHNFGSVGLTTNFEIGTNGRIRLGSSFTTDADGYILAPFGNFIFGTNIYYTQPNWIYAKNGYGAYIQMEATTGTISFVRAPLNSGGPGVTATPVGSATFWNTGNFSVNKIADAGWKVDIGATTDGLRVTGSGTTSATTGFRVETSGATTNFIVLDNGNCGVRVASPTARMHLVTAGATTASIGLRVRNSADTVDIIGSYGTTQVVINSTSGALSTSAQFQIDSTTRGFLPPRMTGAQAEAITGPASGLLVYSTDGSGAIITSLGWWGFDGTTWVKLN